MVLVCTGIVFLIDWGRERDKIFPSGFPGIIIDYISGLLLFFFLLGLLSIIFGLMYIVFAACSKICGFGETNKESLNYSYDTYPYYHR
jgi:hypothetical protein